jgi:hypothetical protein
MPYLINITVFSRIILTSQFTLKLTKTAVRLYSLTLTRTQDIHALALYPYTVSHYLITPVTTQPSYNTGHYPNGL